MISVSCSTDLSFYFVQQSFIFLLERLKRENRENSKVQENKSRAFFQLNYSFLIIYQVKRKKIVSCYHTTKYINQYIYVYIKKEVEKMVSKTEVIINYMLKNSKEKDNRIYSNKLNYWYFLKKKRKEIIREGEITNIRASYYEINQLYKEFIESGVNK